MNIDKTEAIIEALLFATGDAISLKSISDCINKDEDTTKSIILSLMDKYKKANRGIKVIQVDNSFQMCTNPEYFSYIKNLYTVPNKKVLSQTLLETLAIIAYKQPITKGQIEYIRGVNSDHAVNSLIKYNLVEEKGRLDAPGKPILFATTQDFLKHFGFTSLESMPNIEDDEYIQIQVQEEVYKNNEK